MVTRSEVVVFGGAVRAGVDACIAPDKDVVVALIVPVFTDVVSLKGGEELSAVCGFRVVDTCDNEVLLAISSGVGTVVEWLVVGPVVPSDPTGVISVTGAIVVVVLDMFVEVMTALVCVG